MLTLTESASPSVESFFEFDLIEPIQRALHAEGYYRPTPIQAAAIGPLLQGRDLLGCAQTGTGKTAAFAIPILQKLDALDRRPRRKAPPVLVLAPTRELATQIADSFDTYGRHLKFRMTTVFGGVSQGRQVQALQRGVDICVATPGRLLDLFGQGALCFDDVHTFILDEADRMLDMGFLPDLRRIMRELPEQRHSLFFSATMAPPVKKLAAGLLTDHVEVIVTPPASTVDRIEQCVMMVPHTDKLKLLQHVMQTEATGQVLVFTNTKRGADRLKKHLCKDGLRCEAIHGGKTQAGRNRVLQAFKKGKLDVLIATDLAARGLDIDGLSHVVNFDIPHDPDSYVHRIGRTGRAGADGMAITFCTVNDWDSLKAVEKQIGKRIRIESNQPHHDRFNEADARRAKLAAGPSRRGRGGSGGGGGTRRGNSAGQGGRGGQGGGWKTKFPANKKKRRSGSTDPLDSRSRSSRDGGGGNAAGSRKPHKSRRRGKPGSK
ncbi:DEAD/DEAH box helicase [Roseimaritima sediminicola]|uniref:DEAD/DEAH box helicase n=1 Tax=Roseimaritima sediminicola TaxID=2662066 RepID=UPI00192A6481|nr:DEAD/DEAH box helicase [Roseimaritima sediminicola]